MNYELCKKLKGAGFPQENKTFYRVQIAEHDGKPVYEDMHNTCDWNPMDEEEPLALPTLSELIEACGMDIKILLGTVKTNGWLQVR